MADPAFDLQCLPADYSAHERWAEQAVEARCAELGAALGELSPAARDAVSEAYHEIAVARYLRELGSASGDPRLLTQSSSVGSKAVSTLRQAIALAALEAQTRRSRGPTEVDLSDFGVD